MAEIKLLPCPFCGSDAVPSAACNRAGNQTGHVITRSSCWSATAAMPRHTQAIAAWNTRAAHTAQAAEVRELAEWVVRWSACKQNLSHETQAATFAAMMEDAEGFMVSLARTALAGDRADG